MDKSHPGCSYKVCSYKEKRVRNSLKLLRLYNHSQIGYDVKIGTELQNLSHLFLFALPLPFMSIMHFFI